MRVRTATLRRHRPHPGRGERRVNRRRTSGDPGATSHPEHHRTGLTVHQLEGPATANSPTAYLDRHSDRDDREHYLSAKHSDRGDRERSATHSDRGDRERIVTSVTSPTTAPDGDGTDSDELRMGATEERRSGPLHT